MPSPGLAQAATKRPGPAVARRHAIIPRFFYSLKLFLLQFILTFFKLSRTRCLVRTVFSRGRPHAIPHYYENLTHRRAISEVMLR